MENSRLERAELWGSLLLTFIGRWLSKDSPGDFKRWELTMPRFAKNLSSAYRADSEEKTRKRGYSDHSLRYARRRAFRGDHGDGWWVPAAALNGEVGGAKRSERSGEVLR